mgnify:CR=1 FL=1
MYIVVPRKCLSLSLLFLYVAFTSELIFFFLLPQLFSISTYTIVFTLLQMFTYWRPIPNIMVCHCSDESRVWVTYQHIFAHNNNPLTSSQAEIIQGNPPGPSPIESWILKINNVLILPCKRFPHFGNLIMLSRHVSLVYKMILIDPMSVKVNHHLS